MKPHFPSSPTRPPVAVLYFSFDGKRLVSNWGALYAAQRQLLDAINGHNYKLSKEDVTGAPLLTTDNGLIVKSYDLDNILEYEPKGEEKSWQLPERDAAVLLRFLSRAQTPRASTPATALKPREPREPREPKAPRPDGLVSIADIAAGFGSLMKACV